jgi:collagenase-like PrtC family protease
MNKRNPSWDYMAEDYGLKSPQPIMCSSRESDNHMYMFQSGSKYYIWNLMAGTVWEIMTSMDLVGIVAQITKLGVKSLKIKRLDQV